MEDNLGLKTTSNCAALKFLILLHSWITRHCSQCQAQSLDCGWHSWHPNWYVAAGFGIQLWCNPPTIGTESGSAWCSPNVSRLVCQALYLGLLWLLVLTCLDVKLILSLSSTLRLFNSDHSAYATNSGVVAIQDKIKFLSCMKNLKLFTIL